MQRKKSFFLINKKNFDREIFEIRYSLDANKTSHLIPKQDFLQLAPEIMAFFEEIPKF